MKQTLSFCKNGIFLSLLCLVILIAGCSPPCPEKETAPTAQPQATSEATPSLTPAEVIIPEPEAITPTQTKDTRSQRFYVYLDKESPHNHFIPSGWMGDHGDLRFDDAWLKEPYTGTTAIKIDYSAQKSTRQGWAGIYWQSDQNNWGSKQTGFDLSSYNKLVFYAKGEKGGEVITVVKSGGITQNPDGTSVLYPDTAEIEFGPIQLTNEWKKYTVNLIDQDLSYINGGFCLVFGADQTEKQQTIYLDEVYYALDPLLCRDKTQLPFPFYVYADKGALNNHFTPSGWMPNAATAKDITFDPNWEKYPVKGKTSIRITYKDGSGNRWAGIYWQDPANNWGTVPQAGFDLTGATKLTFWARGEKGAEVINEFKAGGLTSGEYPDSDSASIGPIELTNEWQQFEIDLTGKDLTKVIGGFCWATNIDVNDPQGITFYLDEIRYEGRGTAPGKLAGAKPTTGMLLTQQKPPRAQPTPSASQEFTIKTLAEGGYLLLKKDEPFLVKGVSYNPAPIGKGYDYDFASDPNKPWLVDGKLMQEAGINCVRIYSAGKSLDDLRVFIRDMHEKFGIYTIVSDWLGLWDTPGANYADPAFRKKTTERLVAMAQELKDEKGILMWMLGNENNYTFSGKIGFWTSPEIEKLPNCDKIFKKAEIYYSFVDELAAAIKQVDPNHLVSLGNGEASFLDIAAKVSDNIDILGIISYRGKLFGNLFDVVKSFMDKPIIVSEFGCDSYDAYKNQEDQAIQATFLLSQWNDLYKNTVFSGNTNGNALGGVIFEWVDEWWKHDEGYTKNWPIHNTEAGWSNGSYYFDARAKDNRNMNEEWFGLLSLSEEKDNTINKRIPKESYTAIKDFLASLTTEIPQK